MRRAAFVFLLVLAACSKTAEPEQATTATTVSLRAVCKEELARLEATLPKPKASSAEPDLEPRVHGLVADAARAQGKARGLALRDAAEIGAPAVPVLVAIVDEKTRDAAERRTALDMLGEIEVEAASEALAARMDIRFFHEPWLRAHAAFALGRQTRDAWLPNVIPLLEYETDGETVLWIAAALAKHGHYGGLTGLAVLSSSAADADLRSRAVGMEAELVQQAGFADASALRAAWSGAPGAAPLPAREPSAELRVATWRAIARLGEYNLRLVDDARYALVNNAPWVVELLVAALREQDAHIRLHVTQCLDRIGTRASPACAELRVLLDEPQTAASAALALGGVRCNDALSALVERTARDRAPELRAAAAVALGRIGDASASTALQALLDPAEPMDLRQSAAQALLLLGDEARALPLLVECLSARSADQDAAEAALDAWLVKRAETNAEDRARLDAWRSAGPAITGIPAYEQVAERRAARAVIARQFAAR